MIEICESRNLAKKVYKYNSASIQLHVENRIGDPGNVAKVLAKHFCKTNSYISPPLYLLCFPNVLISGRDIQSLHKTRTNQTRLIWHPWLYYEGMFGYIRVCT